MLSALPSVPAASSMLQVSRLAHSPRGRGHVEAEAALQNLGSEYMQHIVAWFMLGLGLNVYTAQRDSMPKRVLCAQIQARHPVLVHLTLLTACCSCLLYSWVQGSRLTVYTVPCDAA